MKMLCTFEEKYNQIQYRNTTYMQYWKLKKWENFIFFIVFYNVIYTQMKDKKILYPMVQFFKKNVNVCKR